MPSHNSATSLTNAYELFQLDNQVRRFTKPTHQFYAYHLGKFIDWCKEQGVTHVHEVTPLVIRQYQISLEGLATYTQNGAGRAVRRFMRFCVEENLITAAPQVKVPTPDKKILPSFSLGEIKRLLKACQTEREKAVVLVLLDSGVRVSELCRLNVADIDLKTGEVTINQGKGKKDRTVFLGAKARKQLLRYFFDNQPGPKQPVFRSQVANKRLTRFGIAQLLRKLGNRAGVQHCHPHTFRRTFALLALRNGMNVYALQRIMGHEDLSTLLKYLGLTKDDLHIAHQQAGPVDNMPD